jgi:hypothetical protein
VSPSISQNADTIANVPWNSDLKSLTDSRKDVGWRIQVLEEDVWTWMICAKIFPYRLKNEQKQRSFTSRWGFVETFQYNPSLLDCTVIGDESRYFNLNQRRNVRARTEPQSQCQSHT